MIDLHSHVLPGVDDGARDLDEALDMLRLAAADGTRVLCATPHVLGPDLDVAPDRARAAFDALDAARRAAGIDVELALAGEVWFRTDLPALARAGRLPTFSAAGVRHVLVEFPPTHVPPEAAEVLFQVRLEGYVPVIAHPERNPTFWADPAAAIALRAQGALLQVTAGALTGAFRRETEACAKALAKAGAVDVLASDAHRRDRRPPGLCAARKVLAHWAGRGRADRAVEAAPGAVVAGERAPEGDA